MGKPGDHVALGFRVKSGFAIAVVLRGPASAPTIASRELVSLSDPEAAETRQPYHHGFFTHETDDREIARRVKIVKRCAKRSVDALFKAGLEGSRCVGAGLAVGSLIDPQRVGNPHIRAHASEGWLFRTVLEDALRSHGIACETTVEKQLAVRTSAGLARKPADIARVVTGFGKIVGGPWRAEEKAASMAAWLALKQPK